MLLKMCLILLVLEEYIAVFESSDHELVKRRIALELDACQRMNGLEVSALRLLAVDIKVYTLFK
jgi:hypothetical protein